LLIRVPPRFRRQIARLRGYPASLVCDGRMGEPRPGRGVVRYEGVEEAENRRRVFRSILDVLVLPRWGGVRLADIAYEDVQTWVSGLSIDGGVRFRTGLSASRVVQTYQVLNMVLKYAIRAKRLGKPGRRHRTAVSDRHREAAPIASAGAGAGRRVWTVPHSCAGAVLLRASVWRGGRAAPQERRPQTGAHLGRGVGNECCAPRDCGNGHKTHGARKVPIPASVVELLRTELQTEAEALVFSGRKGGYLPLGEFRWSFDQAVTALRAAAAAKRQEEVEQTQEAVTPEFPAITPHELRHTCASLAINAGANIKVLQTLLGHKTATLTLDRYGHLYPDELGIIAAALDDGTRNAAASLRPQTLPGTPPRLHMVP
jgi:Phage integrase family